MVLECSMETSLWSWQRLLLSGRGSKTVKALPSSAANKKPDLYRGTNPSDRESGSCPPFESPQGGEQLVEPQSDLYSGRSFTPKGGNFRVPFCPNYQLTS